MYLKLGDKALQTIHEILNTSSKHLEAIQDQSVALVVTSPPYPMIEMWDDIFISQNPDIEKAILDGEGYQAFELMHKILDEIWEEVDRKVMKNGFVCINIGDATKNINNHFQLFSNHSRIIQKFVQMGYSVLPDIIWRKQTNAPNKFMGSGMYPAGAYVTFEHEYILIFRKGGKREFKSNEEKQLRQQSAYFWEERNLYFSDLWDLKGTSQQMKVQKSRERSGAFPFELAYRLINMYSIKGDTVLDPFVGTGTTVYAAMCAERNSYGVELDTELAFNIAEAAGSLQNNLNTVIEHRLQQHKQFVEVEEAKGKDKWYVNVPHQFKVKTRQEINLQLTFIESILSMDNKVFVNYSDSGKMPSGT